MEEKKKFNSRSALSSITCILSFLFGWALTIAGFCVDPVGKVDDSVLWILGQALIYCASILGISSYYSTELKMFKRDVMANVKKAEK